MSQLIYHITHLLDWQAAQTAGSYKAASLASEGFIHCSFPRQLERVANKFYAGHTGLVILVIDSARLSSQLKIERAVDIQDDYPHIYGPIDMDAVLKVVDLTSDENGIFQIPPEIG